MTAPLGWFPDVVPSRLRWFDLRQRRWRSVDPTRPRDAALVAELPPVLFGAVFVVPACVLALLDAPAAAAAMAPLALLAAGMRWWLDRPLRVAAPMRRYAFAWGAFVATLMAIAVSGLASFATGELTAVFPAPLIEEIAKLAVLIPLVRARSVVCRWEAVVAVTWSAFGFTVIEDVLYLSDAAAAPGSAFVVTFVARILASPLAHVLFSLPTAFAAGVALERPGRHWRLLAAGVAASAALHMAWNAALMLVSDPTPQLIAVWAAVWVAVWAVGVVVVVRLRRQVRSSLPERVTVGLVRCGLPAEVAPALFAAGDSSSAAALVECRRTAFAVGSVADPPSPLLLCVRVRYSTLAASGWVPPVPMLLPGWYSDATFTWLWRWWNGWAWSTPVTLPAPVAPTVAP